MKKTIVMLLTAATLLFCVAFTGLTVSATDEVAFAGPVGDVYVPSADAAGATPTIDGVIDSTEPYTDPIRIDATNGATAWSYRSRNLITIDYYNSWDTEGIYIAATITDPTPYYSTVSPDTDEDGEGNTAYGGDGDVFVFCIDPLSLKAGVGKLDGESYAATAWYSVAPMTDGSYAIYRGRYNEGDITDQVESAIVSNSDNTYTLEMKLSWEMILADTAACCGTTVDALGVTTADLASEGAVHNVMLRYMDRWAYSSKDSYSGYHVGYLDEGARFTISCNITCNDNIGNAVDASIYGIYLHMSEGKRYTSGDYTYISVNNDTEAKILSYNGGSVNPLVIPKTIDGKTVTYISAKAFSTLPKINIYVPSTVETLEKNAFYGCLGTKLYVVEGSAAHTYALTYFKNNYVLSCDEHTEGEWVVTTEPTCSAYGAQKMSCAVCGLQLGSASVAKLDHTPGEPTVTTEATCNANGVKTTYCTVCGTKVSSASYTDPDNHAYDDTWYYNGIDFCQGGYKWRNCTRCGLEEKSNEGITECVAGEWFTVIEPTETTSGFKVKQCTCCGKIMESEMIGRLVDKVIQSLTIEVTELDEGVKDVFIAKGAHIYYRQVANNKIYGEYALKLETKDWYTSYTVAEPGVYTVYIRYADGRAPFYYHVTVDLPTPEISVTTDGLTATVYGTTDVKAIRIGMGDVAIGSIKTAEGYKGISGIDTDPYTISFKTAGTWTIVVEFNSGIKVKQVVTLTA